MKDLELRLQKRQIQHTNQVHSLEDSSVRDSGDEDYVSLDTSIEACVLEMIAPSENTADQGPSPG
jgi:hypothetical protein